ncbi:MAG: zinc ABC transporter substrate-binding protein [Cyanobacteria bacterium P01_D01_bin.36]
MNLSSSRLFIKLSALSFALSLVGNAQASHAQNSPQVVATYSVLCDLTEQIAQSTVDVACLIGAGEDPHVYSATPADRRAIEDADLVLYGGYNFEPAIIQMIEATETDAPKIAVSEVAVPEPLMGGHHDHGDEHSDEDHDEHGDEDHDEHGHEDHDEHGDEDHDEHDHEESKAGHDGDHDHDEHGDEDHDEHGDEEAMEADPHVWHDAENGIAMAKEIQAQLSEVSPENAALYATNAEALIAQLEQLDTWIQTQIETVPADGRTLISTHDALGYYADAYGIEIEPALDSFSTEARPSAAAIRELVEVVKETGVPSIFVESTSNPGLIEAVARETDIAVSEDPIYADSLGEAGTVAASYQGMLMTNTCTIVDGLGGTCDEATVQAILE